MKLVCDFGLDDRLRLCSAVFDALSRAETLEGNNEQQHFVRHDQGCVQKLVKIKETETAVKLLPCRFTTSNRDWVPFHVLADARKDGAVFAFFEENDGILHLHARITQIGVLLDPVGPKEKKAERNKKETKDEKLEQQRKCKGKKRRPIKIEEDTSEEENDPEYISEEDNNFKDCSEEEYDTEDICEDDDESEDSSESDDDLEEDLIEKITKMRTTGKRLKRRKRTNLNDVIRAAPFMNRDG